MATVTDRRSLALLALGGFALLAGLLGALALLGIGVPRETMALAPSHGVLMAFGFLGTVIALERAVALGARWASLAPLASGLAAASLILGVDGPLPGLLLLSGSLVFVAMYVAFDRVEVALHTRTQAVGGMAWVVAALLWLGQQPVSTIVPWMAAFLVLTIAGERLELSRLGRLEPSARRTFVAAVALFLTGAALSLLIPDAGVRVAGLGLLGMTAWLAIHDLARRTVRTPGVTRFIALCLLIGYGWLALAGALWLGFGAAVGTAYDAQLHSLFLGFVISMVFGHAPVIVPAVLRVPLPYRPRFYGHLAVLHVGLLLRVVGGDLLGVPWLLTVGGVMNVAALVLFVASSVTAVAQALAARRSVAIVPRAASREATH